MIEGFSFPLLRTLFLSKFV